MTDAILVLNAGSSSLKFAVYKVIHGGLDPHLRGKISGIGTDPIFAANDATGHTLPGENFGQMGPMTDLDDLIPKLLDWLEAHQGGVTITAVGHRVVHGGRDYVEPALVTNTLLTDLDALVPLAPMHQPHNLTAIRCVTTSAPTLPQVACFDTSFHRTQNRLAQLFALPRSLTDEGIVRYGFHGLSYDYIAGTLPTHLGVRADGRVVVAHLGSGASMCAMNNRCSVATSMGFTALDGLMMGRRCGTLDPGVLLYLMQEKGMTAKEIETLLYKQSGLLGVSGISSDMAVLESSDNERATEALELFCYRAARELAALATDMGGIDAIVFTAGIGENSARVRRQICKRLEWLGVDLDPVANERLARRISSATSRVEILVIPTDEEAIIAGATRTLTCISTPLAPIL
ncbi:MAG: acetate/propionate family kinase [Yoonia sp.]|uniref:acetate/propionate family kinase n=1 Tax=Yoonia sp. TaxID=2212373 RepID=UPI003EF8CA8A